MNKDYYKKFSLGLVVDADPDMFENFIIEYKDYINDFYFSLPLGDKFHSRIKVKEQLKKIDVVKNMYKLLQIIQKHGVKLELLFNTAGLTENDFIQSKKQLEEQKINLSLVCIVDEYYGLAKKYFGDKKIILSFNEARTGINSYKEIVNKYDYAVVGRSDIRNERLFDCINQSSRVILLVNNGCSFICGGCSSLFNCHYSYYKAKQNYSSQYLYALQSIFPSELKEINKNNTVSLFKIASRNANLDYLIKCINSYIFCNEEELIKNSFTNYNLYARLSWHEEYFDSFSFDEILKIKKDILMEQTAKYKVDFAGYRVAVYAFNKKLSVGKINEIINQYQSNKRYQNKYIIDRIIIDDSPNKDELISYYKSLGYNVSLANSFKIANAETGNSTPFSICVNGCDYGQDLAKLYNLTNLDDNYILDYNENGFKIAKNNKFKLFISVNYSFKENKFTKITQAIFKSLMEGRAIGLIAIYDE